MGSFYDSKKEVYRKVLKILIFSILIVMIYIIYFQVNKFILIKKVRTQFSESGKLVYQIEYLYEEKGEIFFEGFVFRKGVSSSKKDRWILVLHDMESGKDIFLKTSNFLRDDVNEYFECEYDYSYSGFKAKIKKSKLDFESGKYQFYLYYSVPTEEMYGAIESYLLDGKLVDVNILENIPFDYKGTEIEKLLQKAEIRVSRPDFGICVYQKGGELFWIANEKFNFAKDTKTYIQFQMNTTQIERLPAERLENKWYWSNIGFFFEDNEIFGDFGEFRISRAEIPKEYSVTDIQTGFYDDTGWVWEQYFFAKYALLWD